MATRSTQVRRRTSRSRIVAEVDRRLSIVREVEAVVERNLKRAQALRQAVLARAFGQDGCDAVAVETAEATA